MNKRDRIRELRAAGKTFQEIANIFGTSRQAVHELITTTPRHHRSDARLYEYEGGTHSLREWAALKGISHHVFASRLLQGWSIARTLTTPVRPYRPRGATNPLTPDTMTDVRSELVYHVEHAVTADTPKTLPLSRMQTRQSFGVLVPPQSTRGAAHWVVARDLSTTGESVKLCCFTEWDGDQSPRSQAFAHAQQLNMRVRQLLELLPDHVVSYTVDPARGFSDWRSQEQAAS